MTSEEWESSDLIMEPSDLGLSEDTLVTKVGDGESRWSDLPYTFDEVLSKASNFLEFPDNHLIEIERRESAIGKLKNLRAEVPDEIA